MNQQSLNLNLTNDQQKIDNCQSNSILSTSSDSCPCQTQAFQIPSFLPEQSKKKRICQFVILVMQKIVQ